MHVRPRIDRETLEFIPIGLAVVTAPIWLKAVAGLICYIAGVL